MSRLITDAVLRVTKSLREDSYRGLLLIAIGMFVVVGSITAFILDMDELPSSSSAISRSSSNTKGFLPLISNRSTGAESEQIDEDGVELLNTSGNELERGGVLLNSKSTGSDLVSKAVPQRIVIPAIDLDAPIYQAQYETYEEDEREFIMWLAPQVFGAGWLPDSAGLGSKGNTVLTGHHNVRGEVFRYLEELEGGETIILYSDGRSYLYRLEEKILVQERYKSLETRLQNASWILPTEDERLTLVTCWPYMDNSYRLILLAKPMKDDLLIESD